MVLVTILKRKDGSSVIVAVVVAFILAQMLPGLTGSLANTLSGAEDGQTFSAAIPGATWQSQYLQPIVWAVLQLLLLEVIAWLVIFISSMMKKK